MAYDSTPASAPKGNTKERAKRWEARGDELFKIQEQHCIFWQAQCEIFYPERADFTYQQSEGTERYDGLYTSVPQIMRRDLGNSLGAMLRPRGEEWFKAVARPGRLMKIDSVKAWCEHATERQREVIYAPKANFSRAMSESDHDYAAIGNAIVGLTDNDDRSGLLFQCLHPRDCAWAENAEGVIDEMHRKITRTLTQLHRMFKDALPKEWIERLKDHPHEKRTIRHCVAPIDQYDYAPGEKPSAKNASFKFMSIYIACGEKEPFLAENYFTAFPYLVRRWMTVSGEAYARSPASAVALADSRSLNVAEQSILKAIEWTVDPPKMIRDELVSGDIRLEAGSFTAVDAGHDNRFGKAIENFEVGDPKWGLQYTAIKNQQLALAWYQNILKLPVDRTMTAEEVRERLKILVREAAPIIEPMEADNSRLMDAVFEKITEHNGFDDPPEELIGAEVTYEFETPLTSARKELKSVNVSAKTALIRQMMDVWPQAPDSVDVDAMVREGVMADMPMDYLKDPEVVAEERAARAEQRAQEQQAALAMEAGKTALNAKPENLQMAEQAFGQQPQGVA